MRARASGCLRRHDSWLVRGVALFLLILLTAPVFAQHDERAVRAAFVFHLTKYVEWQQTGNEIVIGFVGEGGMAETLHKVVNGKSSDSRTVRVLILPSDEQLSQCNLVYIAYPSRGKVQATLNKLRAKNVLTVGENDEFVRDGGMVGLVRDADQIQIQVNLEATQAAGLKISSRLLSLAVVVRNKGGH